MESTSLSNLDLTEIERSATSPIPAAIMEIQNPSEQERQLAAKASTAFFNKKSYVEALAWLDKLVALRPNDPRVAGNFTLVNFLVEGGGFNDLAKFQVDLKNTYCNVLSVQGEFDVAELPVLVFNLALSAFYQKNFSAAKKLLEQIHLSLSVLPASPTTAAATNPSNNINNFKFHHLLPLLISACLHANKPNQALAYLGEAESLSKQLDEDSNFLSRSVLFRAHALVLLKQHKTFKRDMKPTGLSPEQTTVYEFFRSNLEFLKGNHRKAAKLLALALQHQPLENVTSRLSSFYENNLGCLHLMMSKPNLAVFFFDRSLQQQSKHVTETKGQKVIPKNAALTIKQTEIIYNLGLALLHSGQPEQAFQSFSSCLPAMESNPSLWLHLAECCIMATKKSFSDDVRGFFSKNVTSNDKSSKAILTAVGTGVHRKLALRSTPETKSQTDVETLSTLTLEYAAQCLKNALQFCGLPEIEERVVATSASPRGNGNSSSTSSSTQTSPLKSPSSIHKSLLLRASILLNSAYVALCLKNPVPALDFSERLLEFNKNCTLPGGYQTLAHIYAAQALLQLSRISEATGHLDPTLIQDNSFSETGDSGEDSNQKSVNSTSAARAVFHFNLSIAYIVRGEHERAESVIDKLMSDDKDQQDRFGIQAKLLSLQLYIQLARGNVDRCRELAIKHCGIVQNN